MSNHRKKQHSEKGATEFHALRQFFSGYLHQDFGDEHGSAAGAAEAFRSDASESELEAVRREWKAWRAALGQAPISEIGAAARKLGAGWQPQGTQELDLVEAALNSK